MEFRGKILVAFFKNLENSVQFNIWNKNLLYGSDSEFDRRLKVEDMFSEISVINST